MTLTDLRKAYKLYANKNADKLTVRHNVLSYLRAKALLGNKWLLATPVQRKKLA